MLPLKTSHYRLDIKPNTDKLLIVFPGLTNMEGYFGFAAQARGIKASRLFYSNMHPSWSAGGIGGLMDAAEEMIAELRALVEQSGAKRLYVFGASFGGFAATLIGTIFNAESTVVMAGQAVLNIPGTRGHRMTRGTEYASPYADIRGQMAQHPPRNMHLVCGERDTSDLMCMLHFAGVPGVDRHVFRGLDHHITSRFMTARRIKPIIAGLVDGTLDLASIPGHLSLDMTPEAGDRLRAGLDAQRRNEHQASEEHFRALTELMPESALGWRTLGESLRGQQRWDEALEATQKALDLDEGDPRVIAAHAMTLGRLNRWEDALKACEKGRALAPNNSELSKMEGRLSAKVKQIEEARKKQEAREEKRKETQAREQKKQEKRQEASAREAQKEEKRKSWRAREEQRAEKRAGSAKKAGQGQDAAPTAA